MGRINLSMLMDPSKDRPAPERTFDRDRGPRRDSRDTRGGGGGFRRNDSRGPRRDDNRERTPSSGPHFPKSRLMGSDSSRDRFGR